MLYPPLIYPILPQTLVLKQPEVSHLIHKIRQLTALSQEKLAATLGVAYCTVNRWENGHIQPSALALKQIRTLLKELKNSEVTLQQRSQKLLAQYFSSEELSVR